MPTRSRQSSDSSDSDKKPRRTRRDQSVDYGDMDDGPDSEAEASVGDAPPDDDDLEVDGDSDNSEEEFSSRQNKKRRKGGKNGKSSNKPESGSRRTSSRATKFQSSMAEPDGNKEFLEKLSPVKKVAKSKGDSLATLHLTASPHKSPARRHARPRLSIKNGTESDDDFQDADSYEEEDEEEDDEGDEEPLKVQRILACRTEMKKKWKEICSSMQTSEIEFGSRWFQAGENESEADGDRYEERFLIKWADLSYLHCSWETEEDLLEQVEKGKTYIQTFFRKSHGGVLFSADERCDGDYFDPALTQIDRVLEVVMPEGSETSTTTAEQEDGWTKNDFGMIHDKSDPKFEDGTGRQFLVKWEHSPYFDSTYEFERDLILNDVDYKEPLKNFLSWSHKPTKKEIRSAQKSSEDQRRKLFKVFGSESSLSESAREKAVQKYQKDLEDRVYKNGGQVRDYQAEGISWMLSNYVNNRSSILADEMGLGKTLQTVATVETMANRLSSGGVFLVIAPLSTLSHWEREFRRWTDLNTVVYHGSLDDRKVIREHEFAYQAHRPKAGLGMNSLYLKKCKPKSLARGESPWMVQVVITTPEMIVTDDFVELTSLEWEAVIVDEAHRLKNHNSKLAVNLRDSRFHFEHIILLTGTPIQNDVKEFWTLLNFLEPDDFDSLDDFMDKYGDMKSKESVDKLHNEIRPYILRRLKEDVEKSVPPKEETLIEVELTLSQKKYYRALYEKNVKFLHKNNKKSLDGPSLNNLAMQLRKCCNHLYMLNGVEDEFRSQAPSDQSEADFLAKGSGKLVLLDKLLPRLKEEGHRVLVFSQFKTMLDILEDYFHARDFLCERIDGSITGSRRQQAIDRFQAPPTKGKALPFVMMLSTRAGGVGINLTAADTCDWNPQNDLQAQARCHRIGQTKSVKVYRLLTRNTYEMQMFHMSSMKMGLDQAVLKGFENSAAGEGSLSKDEVEKLLRHGAYDIFNEEKAGSAEAESNAFVEQDLDSILQRRSRTVVHENTGSQSGAAGSTFSKASFKATRTPDKSKAKLDDVDIMDPDFWKKMVGEGQVDDAEEKFATKRNRTQTNYSESAYNKQFHASIRVESDEESDSDSEASSVTEGEMTRWGGHESHEWKKDHVESLIKVLVSFGYNGRTSALLSDKFPFFEQHEQLQTDRMSWALVFLAAVEVSEDDAIQNKKRDERAAEKKALDQSKDSEPSEGGALAAVSQQTDEKKPSDDEYRRLAFEKLFSANRGWLKFTFESALSYARDMDPNSQDVIDKVMGRESSNKNSVSSEFASNVWPSLKNRGWKANLMSEGENAGKRSYTVKDEQFLDEESVLRHARNVHPELGNAIDTLLNTIEENRRRTTEGQDEELVTLRNMQEDEATPALLRRFLERFGPVQLLADRRKAQPLRIPRKLLSTSSIMYQALELNKAAGIEPGSFDAIEKLAEIVVIDKRTALPHPQWTAHHDAVLLQAILKHGWIDQETSCLAITNDRKVTWGRPFDASNIEPETSSSSVNEWDVSGTAGRCVDFLNEFGGLLNELKGLRIDHLVRAYGLEEEENNAVVVDGMPNTKKWCVSDATLNGINPQHISTPLNEAAELPPKRDLVRRAKAVLMKTSNEASIEGQKTPKEDQSYGYAVVDQSLPPNIFVAELLRVLLRTPSSSTSLITKICDWAHREAENIHKEFVDLKREEQSKEMRRIVEQLELVRKRIAKNARQSKNLLRVMLGEKPQQPRKSSEVMFPQDVPAKTTTTKKSARREAKGPSKKASSKTSADRAVNLAVRRVNERRHQLPTQSSLLELTEIETLILMSVCSHGFPVWSENWRTLLAPTEVDSDDTLSWVKFGRNLVTLAQGYLNKARVKAALAKDSLERLKRSIPQVSAGELVDAEEFHTQSVMVCEKSEEALGNATQYAGDADNLAKKATLLVAKVLEKLGPLSGAFFTSMSDDGLGMKVMRWLDNEITRWATSLALLDESTGKPLAYTAVDFLEHLEDKDRHTLEVSAAFDRSECRGLVAQIALMSRLRSLFSLYQGEPLLVRLWTAAKSIERSEGLKWHLRPDWWGQGDSEDFIDHDCLLLERLLDSGFDSILENTHSYGKDDRFSKIAFRHSSLTKAAIQKRANQFARELHSLEEGHKDILSNSLNKPKSTKKSDKKVLSATAQTGLHSFYRTTESSKEVIDMTDSPAVAAKRKSTDQVEASKKPKV